MRILFVMPSIDISGGGPSHSNVNLCHAMARAGVDISLFTCNPIGEVPPLTGKDFEVRFFSRSWPERYGNSNALIDEILRIGHLFDVVNIASLWNILSARAAWATSKIGVPYIITPHGMLSAWNRGIASLHKEVFYRVVHKQQLQQAELLRFLTKHEAASSLPFAPMSKYAVVPNGIWPEDYTDLNGDGFREMFSLGAGRIVLFLGRLNRIKRLDLQCDAFKILAPKFPDLFWAFVGPDDGMGVLIRKRIAIAGLSDRVIMTGLLSGKEKLSALAATTVYCHTSDHEGHSVAITEALISGKPCVVTQGCHFDEIATAKAGFVVRPEPSQIACAIGSILSNKRYAEMMSANARALVMHKYDWNRIARQMMSVYEWLLGCSTKPDCVRMD